MATQPKKKPAAKRQLKKTETVRQRAERGPIQKGARRRLNTSARAASKPVRIVGRGIAKVLRPLAFLLIPFKTKPVRAIGRFLAAVLLFKFFRQAWAELRQVQWPTARETVRLTVAVFIFSIVFGVIIALVDYGLDKVFKKVFID